MDTCQPGEPTGGSLPGEPIGGAYWKSLRTSYPPSSVEMREPKAAGGDGFVAGSEGEMIAAVVAGKWNGAAISMAAGGRLFRSQASRIAVPWAAAHYFDLLREILYWQSLPIM